MSTGELFTWGRDEGEGRLGLGSGGGPGEAGSLSIPSRVNALPVPAAAVFCGGFFTMALTSDGHIWNWGGKGFVVIYEYFSFTLLLSLTFTKHKSKKDPLRIIRILMDFLDKILIVF